VYGSSWCPKKLDDKNIDLHYLYLKVTRRRELRVSWSKSELWSSPYTKAIFSAVSGLLLSKGVENLNILDRSTRFNVAHPQSDSFLRAEWTVPSKCADLKGKPTRKMGSIDLQRLSHLKTLRGTVIVKNQERSEYLWTSFGIRSANLLSENV
jgi:hypothetical protein